MATKVFLICPVRGVDPLTLDRIYSYVLGLSRKDLMVHWPYYDTNQNDPVGLNICLENIDAIRQASEIHVWYDPASVGSVFDLGAALTASLMGTPKKFVIANPDEVHPTDAKSFQNVLLALARNTVGAV